MSQSTDDRSSDRTMIAHVDGERFVFRDDEIDRVLTLGKSAPSTYEAWCRLREYGRRRRVERSS